MSEPGVPWSALMDRGADPAFDRHARLVAEVLDVPAAVVSLIGAGTQVFVGAVGLPEPWQTERVTPLSHSLCQHVIATGAPLAVADTRADPLTASSRAIDDLGVAAYAGTPLRDPQGQVLGVLSAIDTRPRTWSERELSLLDGLGQGCAAELALRLALTASRDAGRHAARTAQAATSEQQRALTAHRASQDALATTQLLLELSEALAAARDVDAVASTIGRLARTGFGASFGAIALAEPRHHRLRYLTPHLLPRAVAGSWSSFPMDAVSPSAVAVRRRQPFFFSDPAAFAAVFPDVAGALAETGLRAVAYLPLVATGQVLGALAVGWNWPHLLPVDTQRALGAFASYTALALQRALLADAQQEVARTLQQALLTPMPQPDHLELAARYLAAAAGHQVGGDWYDAFVGPDGLTHLVIGDVTGHDIAAAAHMGHLRSGLRTLAAANGGTPAQVVTGLDRSSTDLAVGASASLVMARVEAPAPGEPVTTRVLRWTNAGHPPPLLLVPGEGVRVLRHVAPDLIVGFFPDHARHDHTVVVPDGATLLLYTDGLIERRGSDLDTGTERLREALADLGHLPLEELLDQLLSRCLPTAPGGHAPSTSGSDDDVAVLAVRFHTQDQPRPAGAGPAHVP